MDPAQKLLVAINLRTLIWHLRTSNPIVDEAIQKNIFGPFPLSEYQSLVLEMAPSLDKYVLKQGSLKGQDFKKLLTEFSISRENYYDRLSRAIEKRDVSLLKPDSGKEAEKPEAKVDAIAAPPPADKPVQPTTSKPEPSQPQQTVKKPTAPEAKLPTAPREKARVEQELEQVDEKRSPEIVRQAQPDTIQHDTQAQKPAQQGTASQPPSSKTTRIETGRRFSFFRRQPSRTPSSPRGLGWTRRNASVMTNRVGSSLGSLGSQVRNSIGPSLGGFIQRGTRVALPAAANNLLGGLRDRVLPGSGGADSNGGKRGNGGNPVRRVAGGSGDGGRFGDYRGRFGRAVKRRGFLFYLLLLLGLFLIFGFLFGLFDAIPTVECGKGGEVELNKSGPTEVANGAQINYQIIATFKGGCVADLTVTDQIPANTKFIKADSSYKVLGGFDTMNVGSEGKLVGSQVVWELKGVTTNNSATLTLTVEPTKEDVWVVNEAGYNAKFQGGTKVGGSYGDAGTLLPSPLPPPPSNWESIRATILAAFDKYPEVVENYKQAAQINGVAWQVLAGLHFVETAGGVGPDTSLVSGRKIGAVEPDVPRSACAAASFEPGTPVPMGGGCGFNNQLDSAIYAAKHLAGKIGKVPSTFAEAVTALSRYNGGGNANCDEGLPYGPCPPQFYGEDDPYAMSDFDEPHSQTNMYLIFCGDGRRCGSARIFGRPGSMAVVRALSEQKP